MENIRKDFRNMELKTKVKKLIKQANSKGNIKSHVLAYKQTPVELEHHKGNLKAYQKKGD